MNVDHPRQIVLVSAAHGANEFYSVYLPPILPLLVADFGVSYGSAGVLITIFFTAYTVFQLPAGVLADRIGQKSVLVVGMLGLSLGVAIASIARSYEVLVAAQIVAGAGGSTYHPVGLSMISDLEPDETMGRAMGTHGVGGIAGTALAPVFLGGLATVVHWRAALLVSATVGLGVAGVFALSYESPDCARTRTEAGTRDPPRGEPGLETDTGGDPVTRPDGDERTGVLNVPLTPGIMALLVLSVFGNGLLRVVQMLATPFVFERVVESTAIANAALFLSLVGGGVASVIVGNVVDRRDPKRIGAGAFLATGVLVLVTAISPASVAVVLVAFFSIGVAMYAIWPAINVLVSASSDREFSSSLFGLTSTAGGLGGSLGPLAFGFIITGYGVSAAFSAVAGICGLAALVFVVTPKGSFPSRSGPG